MSPNTTPMQASAALPTPAGSEWMSMEGADLPSRAHVSRPWGSLDVSARATAGKQESGRDPVWLALRNPAEFWLWRLFAFELRRWGYAARAHARISAGMAARGAP